MGLDRGMRTTVTVTRKLGASAEDAWAAVEAVGRLDVWFPSISGCVVEGSGVGATRRLTLDGGLGEMIDIVRSVDVERRRLTYERVESPFPVASYLGTVEIFASYYGRAVVAWTVELESEADVAVGVAGLLEGAIGDGVAGMDADLGPATGWASPASSTDPAMTGSNRPLGGPLTLVAVAVAVAFVACALTGPGATSTAAGISPSWSPRRQVVRAARLSRLSVSLSTPNGGNGKRSRAPGVVFDQSKVRVTSV
jgi:hypothetical protein